MNNLFEFARTYNELDHDKTIIEIIQAHLDTQYPQNSLSDRNAWEVEVYIDKFLHLFYQHTKMQGGLRPHKLDYWKNVL